MILNVLPESWRPYAKAIVAVVGAALVAITLAIPDAPDWVAATLSFLTALGVYGQKNETPPTEE